MTIPTQRIGDYPALIWHRNGDFNSEPVEFADGIRGTALEAADVLATFYGVVRTQARTTGSVHVRYDNGRTVEYIGSPCGPDDIDCADVSDWIDATAKVSLSKPQRKALDDFLMAVADDSQGDHLRAQAERLLVEIVGPSVMAKEGV